MGALLPADGSRAERLARRLRGILLETGGLVLVSVLLPFLLLVACVVDGLRWILTRSPWMSGRMVLMLWWFLVGEVWALAALLPIWLSTLGRDTHARRRKIYRLRVAWMSWHVGGLRVLFGLDFDVENLDAVAPGPAVVLMRHASIIDNALGDSIIARQTGLGIRYVLKRELDVLPAIDIGGRWVPTLFVRRGSGESAAELEKILTLAHDVAEDEVVLIYPEGTRFTAAKLARAKAILAERHPQVGRLAEPLRNVLPPRLGGPAALLGAMQGSDVVVCGHVGLDGFEYLSDIWAGGLVGTTVRVRFWRYAGRDVPAQADERLEWLFARWRELDSWVGLHADASQVRSRKLAGAESAP